MPLERHLHTVEVAGSNPLTSCCEQSVMAQMCVIQLRAMRDMSIFPSASLFAFAPLERAWTFAFEPTSRVFLLLILLCDECLESKLDDFHRSLGQSERQFGDRETKDHFLYRQTGVLAFSLFPFPSATRRPDSSSANCRPTDWNVL
jgi:hypothetical protein